VTDPPLREESPSLAARLRPALIITGGATFLSLGGGVLAMAVAGFGIPELALVGPLVSLPTWRVAQGALLALTGVWLACRTQHGRPHTPSAVGAGFAAFYELAFAFVFTISMTVSMWGSGMGPRSVVDMLADIAEGVSAFVTEVPLIALALVAGIALPAWWLTAQLGPTRTPADRAQLARLLGLLLTMHVAATAMLWGAIYAHAVMDNWYGIGIEEFVITMIVGASEGVLYCLGVAAVLLSTRRLRLELLGDHVAQGGEDGVDQEVGLGETDAERRVGDEDITERADDDPV
jgi:hypothetical protein